MQLFYLERKNLLNISYRGMTNENNTSNSDDLRPVKPALYNYDQNWYSDRHRLYGFNVPALDLDFPMIEYDRGMPVALIEAKHRNAALKLWHPSFKAMKVLADNSKIPFFITVYAPEHCAYYVISMNDCARQVPWCDKPRWFNERNYVKLLYWLRKKSCPAEILDQLNGDKLPINPVLLDVEGVPL